MTAYYTILTNIGTAALANAQAAGTTVPFTHIALGDGNGSAVTPVPTRTALVHEVNRVPISSVTEHPTNANWIIVEAVVLSTVGGWTVREIGLYGGTGPILLAHGNFPDTYKPVLETENASRDLTIRMIVEVSSSAVVSLTVDPSVAVATNQSIANSMAAHLLAVDPHPQYLTKAEADAFYDALGIAAADVAAHLASSDPHPQYATDADLSGHVSATDPHPQYTTDAEVDAKIASVSFPPAPALYVLGLTF
ncbi:MAG: phage tail protein [Methylobacter sp.]